MSTIQSPKTQPADVSEARVIGMLGDLIRACRDAETNYRTAAERCGSPELSGRLMDRSHQRAGFVAALQTLQRRHGKSEADDSGTLTGTVHRAWVELRDSLKSTPDAQIIEELLHGECAAIRVYRDVLDDFPTGLYPADAAVVAFHLREIGRSRDELRGHKG